MKIFICYGWKDTTDFAKELFVWLKQQGYEPWLDIENGIPPGAPFDIHIERAISESKLLIALESPWSVRPESFCRNELLYALAKKIPIIPVQVINVGPSILTIPFTHVDAYENPSSVFPKLPNLIEWVVRNGRMPLKEWPSMEGKEPWWTSNRKKFSFEEETARHGGTFVGREWLFTQIQEWLKQPISRLLFLTADVGVGKSAIAAQMTARLNARGVHFCSRSKIESCVPVTWLAELVYQLAFQFPAYRSEIEKLNPPKWGDPPESLFRTLIAEPLRICQKQLNVNASEPWVFVIDSLDESVAAAGTALTDLLADSVERIPAWLRLVVTSRPDQELIARFRIDGVQRYHIEAGGKQNNDDLVFYIKNRVRELVDKQVVPDQPNTIHRLSELAAGNFQYAKTVLDVLGNIESEYCLSLDELGKLPANLCGLYYAMFSKRFSDIDKYERDVLPLLDCLVAALGSLPDKILQVASKLDQRTAQKGILILSQFIDKSDAGLRLFHQSLSDWLSDQQISAKYAASLPNGHNRLAEACWSEFRAGVQNMSTYSIGHLSVHLLEAGRMDYLLELVQNPEMNLITKWTEGEDGDKGIRCLTELIKYLNKNSRELVTAAGLATQVARIYSLRGKYNDAQKWLEYALKKTSRLRGRRIRSIAFHELGSLYLYQRNIKKAKYYYRKALRLCLWGITIFHDEAAANLIGLATVFFAMYDFNKVIQIAKRAIFKAHLVKDIRHIIAGKRILGVAYETLGSYSEAELCLKEAILLCDGNYLHLEKSSVLLALGWTQYDRDILKRNHPVEAKNYFQEAIIEAQISYDLYYLLEAQISCGWCALIEKVTDEALNYFNSVKKSLTETLTFERHPELHAWVKLGFAAILQQKGKTKDAEELYQEAISFCSKYDIRFLNRRAHVGLGAIYWHTGKKSEAELAWEQALQISDQISPAKRTLVQINIELCKYDPFATPQ